jgi:hypothetical protein
MKQPPRGIGALHCNTVNSCLFSKQFEHLVGAPLVGALHKGTHEGCPYETRWLRLRRTALRLLPAGRPAYFRFGLFKPGEFLGLPAALDTHLVGLAERAGAPFSKGKNTSRKGARARRRKAKKGIRLGGLLRLGVLA